jgi:timeless
VLLLRCYNPLLQSQQYLQDLVVTNHILLVLLDEVSKQANPECEIDLNGHVQQFATAEIMSHYGVLLENFRENGEFVNDCIFTMIHHVGGDLNQVATLFQPKILKTFSKLWDSECEICDVSYFNFGVLT